MAARPNKLTVPTVLIVAIAAVAGFALFGFAGATLAGIAAAPVFHISTMEGAQGYFAVAIGLLLGVAGAVALIWLAARWRGLRGLNIVLSGVAALATVFALAAAAVGAWYAVQPHILNQNGPEPILRLEVRAPAGMSVVDLTGELNTDRNGADVVLDPAADAGGQTRTGYVPLYYRTSQRLIVLKAPDGRARLYNLRLPANPTRAAKYTEWSAWQKPDFIDEPGSSGPRRVDSFARDIEIRYHIEPAG